MIEFPDGADSPAGGPLDDRVAITAAVIARHVEVDILLCLGVVPGEEEGGEARVVALGAVGAAEPLLEHLEREG